LIAEQSSLARGAILTGLRTADLCDEFADELEVCLAQFRTYGGRKSFSGEIQTVSTFEDVGLVRQCIEQPGLGRVLVVDGGRSTRVALLGDRLSAKAIENGWAGVLIFGAVRDTEMLATLDLGVMALGVVPARGSFNATGAIGTSFQAGGVRFAPGRFVYCDTDGVVVSSRRFHDL
jgi:regulator of ribonuclease activity A